MKSIDEVWAGIQAALKAMPEVSVTAYDTWLAPLEAREIQDGNLVLYVETAFQKGIILDCYTARLEQAVMQVMGLPLKVRIISGEDDTFPEPPKEENNDVHSVINRRLMDARIPEYEYSFENFIVGSSNQFAHAAAQAVAKEPSSIYNPLFIYGGSGLGKTHLMYAICNEIRMRNPGFKIIYTKAETMTNEIIEAIRNGHTAELREKYRKADMLLVDDIQFIAGKESTQTEFFHTFETLHQSNKQIVLTSDRPPKEISSLEDRLRSRFEAGLLADIQPPDLETRIAIVKRKAQLLQLDLSDEICEYIATQLKTNVRQLEGVVRRIMANQLLAGEKPSLAVAQNAIRDIRSTALPVPVTVDKIMSEVSRTMNVTVDDLRGKKHSAGISRARQVAMYVVREVVGSMSMDAIGQEFGGRDHSTVVYTIQKVEKMMETDDAYKGLIKDIIKNVSSQ